MKHLDCSLTAPAGAFILFCGVVLLFGTDPWLLGKQAAVCLPVVAYVVGAYGALMWVMHGRGPRPVRRGAPLALYVASVAGGTGLVWLATQLERWLGRAA